MAERESEDRSVEECLILDSDKVGAMDELYDDRGGGWIDDGDILRGGDWSPGMGVSKINYCVDGDDFISVQIVLGDDDNEVPLRKHGGTGGTCRAWRLQAEDYIRSV